MLATLTATVGLLAMFAPSLAVSRTTRSTSRAAPSLSLSGTTLKWTASGAGAYRVIGVSRAGGHGENRVVRGTSLTPRPRPGDTITYRVKVRHTKVWSNAVTITWPGKIRKHKEKPAEEETPAEEPPHEEPPTEEPGEEGPGLPGGTLMGVNAQTEPLDLTGVSALGAKAVRVHFSAGEPNASWLLEWDKKYAERGVTMQPLALFDGRMLSAAEAKGLVALAKLPGVKEVEIGNETSYGYQYHDGYSSSSYHERARLYALRVKEAAEVLNPHGIGVLAQAEDGGSGSSTWVKEMFASVPNLSRYVAAWVIHPYSNQHSPSAPDTQGLPKMERMVSNLAEEGDSSTPIAVTEWGISEDEGMPLDNGTSMNSSEAAKIVETTVPKLFSAAKGHPIQSFLVYQVRDQGEHGASKNHEMYFGALTHTDGTKGPFSTAIKTLLAG